MHPGPTAMTRGKQTTLILGLAALTSCGPPSGTASRPPGARPGVGAVAQLTGGQIVAGQTIYIPIYSSVATADNARPINLATTLTIRNLDRARPIVVQSIHYHDSSGRLVRDHLDRALRIDPLASLDLFVAESDTSGGAAPSFLVEWAADGEVLDPPFVQAVMISTAGSQGITLTSPGRVLAPRPGSTSR